MKRFSLAVFLLLSVVFFSFGENVIPVKNWKAGDEASENVLGLEKTSEVFATGPEGCTIIGKDTGCAEKGVFVEGRTVHLDPFIVSRYEVTQELYHEVMKDVTFEFKGEERYCFSTPSGADEVAHWGEQLPANERHRLRPVESLSWYDMVFFCNVLSEMTGLEPAYKISVKKTKSYMDGYENYITDADVTLVSGANGYRLPTEAEWEFCARGGNPDSKEWNYAFSGEPNSKGTMESLEKDKNLDAVAWYASNANKGHFRWVNFEYGEDYHTHEVGMKKANSLGLYDMCGNVAEACWDWKGEIIAAADGKVEVNPAGPESGSIKVFRGSSWCTYAYSVTDRLSEEKTGKQFLNEPLFMDKGFRLVRSVGDPNAKRKTYTSKAKEESKSLWKPGDVAFDSLLGLEKTKIIHATKSYTENIRGNIEDEDVFSKFFVHYMRKIEPFDISCNFVTRELYHKVMEGEFITVNGADYYFDSDPYFSWQHSLDDKTKHNPVEYATNFDAMYFCNVLSRKTGREPVYEMSDFDMTGDKGHIYYAAVKTNLNANGFRLPKPEELEFAYRGADPESEEWKILKKLMDSESPAANSLGISDMNKVVYLAPGTEADISSTRPLIRLVCSSTESQKKDMPGQKKSKGPQKNISQKKNAAVSSQPVSWKAGDVATESVLGLERTREVFALGMEPVVFEEDPDAASKDYLAKSKAMAER